MHAPIVSTPRFHVLGVHGVDGIIVTSRSNRVVVLAWRILDEQVIQPVSINDPSQMYVEFRVRVL